MTIMIEAYLRFVCSLIILYLSFAKAQIIPIGNAGKKDLSNIIRIDENVFDRNIESDLSNGLPRNYTPHMDRAYCITPYVLKSGNQDYERISLVLHVSHDRTFTALTDQVDNWEGPISLSVVFPAGISTQANEVMCQMRRLRQMWRNSTAVREKLNVHFIIKHPIRCNPFYVPPMENNTDDIASDSECDEPERLDRARLIRRIADYPVNAARNIARKLSKTKYFVSADMDHFFSANFEPMMLDLAKRVLDKEPKTVLVYRIFEVNGSVSSYPKNKTELYQLYQTSMAQEFHKRYAGHRIPRQNQWFLHTPDTSGNTTSIQFYRPYVSGHWEPQFVSLKSIPFHDESFFYPLRDNTCLRWEMCRSGYKFAIVNDVFMYHRGIKQKEEKILVNQVRLLITPKAKESLVKFERRMDLMYNSTKSMCPSFRF